MHSKTLILGPNSQVGTAIKRHKMFLGAKHLNLRFERHHKVVIDSYLKNNDIEIIVNCVAYTNVPKAEIEQDLCRYLNRDIPSHLAELSAKRNVRLVHFSTDYVFDGLAEEPYYSSSSCNPQTWYGKTKREGELAILESEAQSTIIRLCGVYSPFRVNFVKKVCDALLNGKELKLPKNIVSNPTYAKDIPYLIDDLVMSNNLRAPIIHFGGASQLSWYDFGKQISVILKEMKLISADSKITSFFDDCSLLNRPNYSVIEDDVYYNKFKTDTVDALSQTIDEIVKNTKSTNAV